MDKLNAKARTVIVYTFVIGTIWMAISLQSIATSLQVIASPVEKE